MVQRITTSDAVQTPFGKGVVREVRNNGRFLVDVQGRALVIAESELSPLEAGRRRPSSGKAASENRSEVSGSPPPSRGARAEVDLHGLTVEEALARVDHTLNEALLSDAAELRLVHGRSGGRIRAAVHRRLREIPSIRGFRLDPRNEGVTIVDL